MPEDIQRILPGYAPDVQKNRAEAREIMHELGYGPDQRLALNASTRDIPPERNPAVILTDQLKEVFIDGEIEIVETAKLVPQGHAAPHVTTPAIAIPSSKSCSIGNNESRRGQAQEAGVGDRKKANGGQCAADHLLQPL